MTRKNENKDFSLEDFDESLKKEKKQRFIRFIIELSMPLISLIIAVILTLLISGQDNTLGKPYFSKSIKANIEKAIQNNADVEVIKHIFNNRIIKKNDVFNSLFNKSPEDKYLDGTPLSTILQDILSDYFLDGKKDTLFLGKIHRIIVSHNQTNPFDKLETNQKNDFENLRIKLNSNFSLIQNDVNRISDELYKKNQLVDEYLDKSNLSYWISIIALFTTILLSVYQIIQNHPRKMIKHIKFLLESEKKENIDK